MTHKIAAAAGGLIGQFIGMGCATLTLLKLLYFKTPFDAADYVAAFFGSAFILGTIKKKVGL